MQFSCFIHLPSWADEGAAFERAAQNRNIDSAVASAAGASGIHLRNTAAKNCYLIAIHDRRGSILAILGAIRAIGSYPIAILPDSGSYPWIASYLSSYLSSYPG